MTNNVRLKHAIGSLLILSLLAGCNMWKAWFGREKMNLGEYVTLQAEKLEPEQKVRWSFSQLPDSSKLLGFLPSDTVSQISFKPDVPGAYDVVLQVISGNDIDETSFLYDAVIAEDSSLVNTEIPEYLFKALLADDTTVTSAPPASSYTDDGIKRTYLSKVVSPSDLAKPKPKKSSPTVKKQIKPKAVAAPNRGNLIPQATKTYTIQLSSWPSLEEAQGASKELMDTYGIDSYVQRAFFKDKDEVYYRLRVGNFENFSEAQAVAKEIQGMTNLPAWVDFLRQEM